MLLLMVMVFSLNYIWWPSLASSTVPCSTKVYCNENKLRLWLVFLNSSTPEWMNHSSSWIKILFLNLFMTWVTNGENNFRIDKVFSEKEVFSLRSERWEKASIQGFLTATSKKVICPKMTKCNEQLLNVLCKLSRRV